VSDSSDDREDLLSVAERTFSPGLSSAERTLLAAIPVGEYAWCGPSHDDKDPDNNPQNAHTWSKDRNIRSALIEWLCTKKTKGIPSRGIRIHAARITGALDLTYGEGSVHLVFYRCNITDPIKMHMFSCRELSFTGSHVVSIDLDRAQITGGLFLDDGFVAEGVVSLENAHIGEDLNGSNAQFNGKLVDKPDFDDYALNGNSIIVGGDVVLDNSHFPNCGLNFSNGRLGGDLTADGASVKCLFATAKKGQTACIGLQSAQVRQDISFGNGMKATGELALEGLVAGGDVSFSGGASLESVSGGGGYNFTLCADDAHIGGNVLMDDKFVSKGVVSFTSTRIQGYLQIDGATFTRDPVDDQVLIGDDSKIEGDFCLNNCKVNGSIDWETAEIFGDLDFSNSSIQFLTKKNHAPAGCALNLGRTVIHGSALFDDAKFWGSLQINNAHVGGDISLKKATLHGRDPGQTDACYSFLAESITVAGDLLAQAATAQGAFVILESTIGGEFGATGGLFSNPYVKADGYPGVAIQASRSSIKGPVFLNSAPDRPFQSIGAINFNDAVLGSDFNGIGARFNSNISDLDPKAGPALTLARAQIQGDLRLDQSIQGAIKTPFVANGKIIFDYAQCGGEAFFDGAHFINPYVKGDDRTGMAFSMFSGKCLRGLNFRAGFSAQGEVNITNSDIGQLLSCRGGSFEAEPVQLEKDLVRALVIAYSWVHGGIQIDQGFHLEGVLDLTGTSTAGFYDDPASWPKKGELRLEGFKYSSFANDTKNSEEWKHRLKWLRLQKSEPFPDQSYRQLSKTLADSGDDHGAQQVLIQLEDDRTRQKTVPAIEGLSRRMLLGRTVGYGYTPINAVWGLASLSLLGWIVYRRAYLSGNLVPSDKSERSNLIDDGEPSPEYGRFAPFVYSVENTVPLVKLGQADKWTLRSHSPSVSWKSEQAAFKDRFRASLEALINALRRPRQLISLQFLSRPPVLRYFYWFQIVAGWILATLFVAGFTGLIHK
jgi:hypothetical protein